MESVNKVFVIVKLDGLVGNVICDFVKTNVVITVYAIVMVIVIAISDLKVKFVMKVM
jgi:hypothetical protein